MAVAAPESDETSANPWEELLRKMLPDGAPLPDEDQLDYSISFDYVGPSPFFEKPPPADCVIPKTRFAAFPKHAPSLTPRNPLWLLDSRSGSRADRSDANRFPFDSVDFENDVDFKTAGDDHGHDHDQYGCSVSDEAKRERCRSELRGKDKCKGRCDRCGKGSSVWLRCMEDCIVCGAEYCKKCVLKAMGTMPEGRKCVGCIGNPVNEGKRVKLGKGSRLLSRVCSRSEIKRIMEDERECKVNKVRPEQVIVNGREIREDELNALMGCELPPRDLKPGRYWYDKDSGLWGKEGEKPNMIISSKLCVGGKLQSDASNGNTMVHVNGREITSVELKVMKLAKVQCTRDTHFWLYEDGSYEEEGQNKIKGNIWEKISIRLISSLVSLPVPPQKARRTKEEPALTSARLCSQSLVQHRVHKLLLLGLEGSETSTVFKQAKFIYSKKSTTEELNDIKLVIQRNLYRYLCTLLEGREHFEEDALIEKEASNRPVPGESESRKCIYSVNQKIHDFSNWFLSIIASGAVETFFPAAAREYAPLIDEIWKDPALQETYKRLEELKFLPTVAKYFLDQVLEISSNEYEPSERDILFAEDITPNNGLAFIEFSFDDHSTVSKTFAEGQPLSKYQLIYQSSRGLYNGHKWLELFEGVSIVIFCISLTDYDQIWTDSSTGSQQNKMLASRNCFENVVKHSSFEGIPFILLLTKYNEFEEKINQVPITVCEWFNEFNPFKINRKTVSMAHQAFYYIALKFKELYASITGRKLYVHNVQCLDRDSVDEGFRYMREIVEWEEVKDGDVFVGEDEDLLSGEEMK